MVQLTMHAGDRAALRLDGLSYAQAMRLLAREAHSIPPGTVYAVRVWREQSYAIVIADGKIVTITRIGASDPRSREE